MSKKISLMPILTTLEDVDWFTGLDEGAASVDANIKITKANALKEYATNTALAGVAQDLTDHEAATGSAAHTGMLVTADMDAHKSAANQHQISGVEGLQAALNAKPDEPANDGNPKLRTTSGGTSSWTDSGGAAILDVGTGSGDVAAGDAVPNHETTYAHANLPSTSQKQAMDAATPTPGSGNPFVTQDGLGVGTDQFVGADDTDVAPGYLIDKLFSSDASVTFTAANDAGDGGARKVDVQATGAGGGESNQGENIGTGKDIYAGMNGVNITMRGILGMQSVVAAQTVDDITVSLENDATSPGNNTVYGVDGAGTRGWKPDPSGTAGNPVRDTLTAEGGDGSNLVVPLDGKAHTVQLVAGQTWVIVGDLASGTPASEEMTCSLDVLAPASGSGTLSMPLSGAQLMEGSTPITLADAADPVSCIFRSRADGVYQIYQSRTAA